MALNRKSLCQGEPEGKQYPLENQREILVLYEGPRSPVAICTQGDKNQGSTKQIKDGMLY